MNLSQANVTKLTEQSLLACCGSHAWVDRILASLPISTLERLHELAETIWWALKPEDWLEAFSAHPQIGHKASNKWSPQEQAGMSVASAETAAIMHTLNQAYLEKFGFIFIVCATGKSADEMRALLERRIANAPNSELQIAAAEQTKIMHIRLDKLLAE